MADAEIWKDIKGYEGLYQASNQGNIRNAQTWVVLRPANNNNKYPTVSLSKNGEKHSKNVHKLIASTFIPNPLNLPQVNHKDEDKTNNCVDNLEWCSNSYNCNYGTRNKKVAKKIKKHIIQSNLDGEEIMCWFSLTDAHDSTNISISKISECLKGKRKTYGGYIWKYA